MPPRFAGGYSGTVKITAIVDRVKAWRPVRVYTHFSDNAGGILAGGMSYQAIFAVFAAVWVVFAVAGLWLTANPDITHALVGLINQSVPGLIGPHGVIDPNALATAGVLGWTGAIAFVGLLFTALGWLSATAQAVRTIFRMPSDTTFFVLVKLRELGLGLLFGLALVVSALISLASTTALGGIFALLHVPQDSFWFDAAVRSSGLLIVFGIDTLTLAALFRVLSAVHIPSARLIAGSLLGAAGLGVLKLLGGSLLGGAGRNPLLTTFAVITGLLIWFNLTSTITLLAASWIAVGMEDAGISPRALSAEQDAAERKRRGWEAARLRARAEVSDARRAYEDAAWHHKWATRRRLREAEKHAEKYDSTGPT